MSAQLSQMQGYALAIAAVAVGVLYAMFFFLPGQRTTEELAATLQMKEDFCLAANSLDASLARSETELAEVVRFVAAWQQATPPDDRSHWHGAITQAASEAGVLTVQFEPAATQPMARLVRHPVALGVRGSFAQVHDLVRRLELLPGAVWIESLQIAKTSDTGEILNCELKLAFFAGSNEKSN